nr:hypothetical protein [Rhizobium phaseoli]
MSDHKGVRIAFGASPSATTDAPGPSSGPSASQPSFSGLINEPGLNLAQMLRPEFLVDFGGLVFDIRRVDHCDAGPGMPVEALASYGKQEARQDLG